MWDEVRGRWKSADGSLITAALILAALYLARAVFIPLALAGLLAFVLTPAASWLERRRVGRTPAALFVIFVSLAGTVALGWMVLGQIYNLAADLPRYQENISKKISLLHLDAEGRLTTTKAMLTKLEKQIEGSDSAALLASPAETNDTSIAPRSGAGSLSSPPVAVRIEQPQESITVALSRTIGSFLGPLTTMFIVVIFLVFMLLGREDLLSRGLRLAGLQRIHLTTTAIEDASQRVSRYLLMQLLVNLSYGAIAGASLWLIGIPHPLLWAVLTCILRFVPYVGILMAAAGPILLSIAISPRWSVLAWTVVMYAVLELVAANFVEPMLYGASTGMSAIAILIAAIFWTILWGFPGLLLSIPLTVCLVVLGGQMPRLNFIEVLLGEERPLPPEDRFYQRMLAGNTHAARVLIEDMMKTQSPEEIYDSVLVPVLTQVEEARHSEEMEGRSADELLQGVEELAEELNNGSRNASEPVWNLQKRVACVPARDFADEVACQLAMQVLDDRATVQVISADASTADLLQSLESLRLDAICVIGVPPHAIRHLRMRCQQIRSRMPDVTVVACVLTKQSDLSNLRSRITTGDAHHVVNSMLLLKEYLNSLLYTPTPESEMPSDTKEEAVVPSQPPETPCDAAEEDVFDEPEEDRFAHLASTLARSLDAPIALITSADGQRRFWEAQCGLPDDLLCAAESAWDLSMCRQIVFSDSTLVLPDTFDNACFANDEFLKKMGIRFYAGAPLKAQNGEVIGSVCVLDTRPRQITEQQKEQLTSIAKAVMTAIELHDVETGMTSTIRHSSQLVS